MGTGREWPVTVPVINRRHLHLLAAFAIVVVTLVVLYLLGTVLLTLGLSVVLAYVLLPLAKLLERVFPWRRGRPGLSRGIAVAVIFLFILGILAGILALVIPPTVEQARQFAEDFPGFLESARTTVEGWVARYAETIPVEVRDRIEETIAGGGSIVGDAAWQVASQTLQVVSGSFAVILGLATAPVLVFYLMKDSSAIRASIYSPFPEALRPHLREALNIADRTIGGYIRGQITLGLIVGVVVTVGLLLLGVPFSFVLGIVAGLTELVPIIGPWIGGAAGVLVTLATAPEKLPWVILFYIAVQMLENTLLVPRVQGDTLKLHPVAVIVVIVLASNFFGLWGVILGPPLVAMGRDMTVYFVNEWNRTEDDGIEGKAEEEEPETRKGDGSTAEDSEPTDCS